MVVCVCVLMMITQMLCGKCLKRVREFVYLFALFISSLPSAHIHIDTEQDQACNIYCNKDIYILHHQLIKTRLRCLRQVTVTTAGYGDYRRLR